MVAQLVRPIALQTIPRTFGRFTKRPVPWWNAACTKVVSGDTVGTRSAWKLFGSDELGPAEF
ncbi:hypothetical protein E2C01_021427 [Portunus trituberculatus]|uniref:Uncharacterized protein n=1 Tax=Portunus trituberculatus TaxID=210409 RepID=A0A5B7E484_PORTR|nr:hypothetical protein [Portunus trituberculatus]